jgi:hypothetical protein
VIDLSWVPNVKYILSGFKIPGKWVYYWSQDEHDITVLEVECVKIVLNSSRGILGTWLKGQCTIPAGAWFPFYLRMLYLIFMWLFYDQTTALLVIILVFVEVKKDSILGWKGWQCPDLSGDCAVVKG